MSTTMIVADVQPAAHARRPLFAVYGVYAGGPQLFDAPIMRPLRAGDIAELGGRFVRMVANHNGQRLQTVDVHDEVCAAFERRGA